MKLKLLKPKKPTRAKPMEGMSPEASQVWIALFAAYPPGHFNPGGYDLLRMYCDSVALHNTIVLELSKTGHIIKNGTPKGYQKNPRLKMARDTERTIRKLHRDFDLKPELLDKFLKPHLNIVGKTDNNS